MNLRHDATTQAYDALVHAQEEARALGHGYVGTEHLLIALCAASPTASGALRQAGVTDEALRDEVARIFAENEWTRYVPDEEALATVGVDLAAVTRAAESEFGAGAVAMRVGNPGFTRRAHDIVEQAVMEARERGGQADVDDLLRALLQDDDSVGARVLQRLAVDRVALRDAL